MSTIYNLGHSHTRRIITALATCGTLSAALIAPHTTPSAHAATHPRKIMLDPEAKSVGIGIAIRSDGKLYAVQNFAR